MQTQTTTNQTSPTETLSLAQRAGDDAFAAAWVSGACPDAMADAYHAAFRAAMRAEMPCHCEKCNPPVGSLTTEQENVILNELCTNAKYQLAYAGVE